MGTFSFSAIRINCWSYIKLRRISVTVLCFREEKKKIVFVLWSMYQGQLVSVLFIQTPITYIVFHLMLMWSCTSSISISFVGLYYIPFAKKRETSDLWRVQIITTNQITYSISIICIFRCVNLHTERVSYLQNDEIPMCVYHNRLCVHLTETKQIFV